MARVLMNNGTIGHNGKTAVIVSMNTCKNWEGMRRDDQGRWREVVIKSFELYVEVCWQ